MYLELLDNNRSFWACFPSLESHHELACGCKIGALRHFGDQNQYLWWGMKRDRCFLIITQKTPRWKCDGSERTASLVHVWTSRNEPVRAARGSRRAAAPRWIPDDSANGWSCDAIISLPAALFSRWATFPIQTSEIESSLIQTCKSHYASYVHTPAGYPPWLHKSI